MKVEQATVAVDQQLYENNKKQLEIGTMAPLDVITAQSQLASDQQALVQAQTVQLQDETTLLVAITKDPLAMTLSGIEIVPTTPISHSAGLGRKYSTADCRSGGLAEASRTSAGRPESQKRQASR